MTTNSYSYEQIMMTLSAMAYQEDLATLKSWLANPKYATGGQWQLVWGPASGDDTAYWMAVVKNEATGEYAVMIRGSVLSVEHPVQTFIDWWHDLGVRDLVPFSGDSSQGKIASGTSLALKVLVGLSDPKTGVSFTDFLGSTGGAKIYVTGHSLGACQASVVTGWIRDLLSGSKVIAYTYAGPTAGDSDFAGFVGVRDFNRVWNQWDLIPQAFEAKTLAATADWYPSPGPQKSLIDDGIYDLLLGLPPDPNPFLQPAGNGKMLANEPAATDSYFDEIGKQHAHNKYLTLLGAPEVP